MALDFTGKVVIVTGASAGIGEATALLFAKYGARVVVVGRNAHNVKKVAERCQKEKGQDALPIIADLGTDEGCEKVATETIMFYGRLDVLVNNAAVGARTTVLKADMDTFDRVFSVNLRAVYNLTRLLAPALIKTKGNIVNVSSIMATMVTTGNLPYSLSKAALDHFSKLAAYELAPHGVRVNVVSPGITMKLMVIVLAIIALIQNNEAERCKEITIDSYASLGEVLKSNVPSPYQLAIDRDTNTLFFSYTANSEETFESVYINLKDNTSGIIRGVSGGFANAVDNQKQIVYIGGRDGIYKFDYATKTATKTDITDDNIWQMFFKDGLYFTTYPGEKAYLYKDGELKLVPGLENTKATLVAIDKNNNTVFSHDSELKMVVDGKIVDLGDYNLNGFNTDADGELYFSTPSGIYRLSDKGLKKVTSVDNLFGFAIEGGGSYILAGESSVSRLDPALPPPSATVCEEDYYDSSTGSTFQYVPLV